MLRPPIALLTDYGPSGVYAAAMRGVILGINPQANIHDLTHGVAPQAVEQGAFLLAQAAPFWPEDTIFIAVVDPGVGGSRRAIAVRTGHGVFVGPDNGVLSVAVDDRQREAAEHTGETDLVPISADSEAVELSNEQYFRKPISQTFHGRDIFAPVAAHLSLGNPLSLMGPPIPSLVAFPPWRAAAHPDGTFIGRVLYADNFGNLVTDVRAQDLPSQRMTATIAGRQFEGLQNTFEDGPEFVLFVGSGGFLELARRNSNAAAALHVGAGEQVRVSPVIAE